MRKRTGSRRKRIPRSVQLDYFLRHLPGINEWRAECLLKYGGKCVITHIFRKSRIHIHHIKAHHIVRNEVLEELGLPMFKTITEYTEDQKTLIILKYIEKHQEIEGIPLLKKVHKIFHKLYGYKATAEDFEEFQNRWAAGEFSKVKIP